MGTPRNLPDEDDTIFGRLREMGHYRVTRALTALALILTFVQMLTPRVMDWVLALAVAGLVPLTAKIVGGLRR